MNNVEIKYNEIIDFLESKKSKIYKYNFNCSTDFDKTIETYYRPCYYKFIPNKVSLNLNIQFNDGFIKNINYEFFIEENLIFENLNKIIVDLNEIQWEKLK